MTQRAGRATPSSGAARALLPALVTLLALALYLFRLESKSLWYDELATLTCAGWGGTWADALQRSLTIPATPKPPLFFLLTRLFLALGDRVFFLRLPAVLFATLTVPLAFALGTRLFDRRVGLLAALLLALAPLYVRYGQEARMYTLLAFLSLLSLYLFWRAIGAGRWHWWLAFALVSALNLYVHLFALLPLGVMALFALALLAWPRRRPCFPFRPAHLFATLALVPLLFGPMVPYFVRGLVEREGLGGTAAPDWSGPMFLDALRLFGGGSDTGLILFLLLFLLAVVVLAVRRHPFLLLALAWILLPVALVQILPFGQATRIRYFIFALPVYLVVVACGLEAAIRWFCARGPWSARAGLGTAFATVVALALLLATGGPSLARYYAETKQNWRDASSLVAGQARPGDIVYVRHLYHRTGFLFYSRQWPGQEGRWTEDNVRLLPDDPARAFRLADQAGYWLIVPDRASFLPGGALEDRLQPYFHFLSPVTFVCDGVPREAEILGPTSYRPVLAVHAAPSRPPTIRFWADDPLLPAGTCTWLRWQVENVREVYLDGQGVPGQDGREVCPARTTAYELEVTHLDGTVGATTLQVEVTP